MIIELFFTDLQKYDMKLIILIFLSHSKTPGCFYLIVETEVE